MTQRAPKVDDAVLVLAPSRRAEPFCGKIASVENGAVVIEAGPGYVIVAPTTALDFEEKKAWLPRERWIYSDRG